MDLFGEDLRAANRLIGQALAASSPTTALGYVVRAQRRLKAATREALAMADMESEAPGDRTVTEELVDLSHVRSKR